MLRPTPQGLGEVREPLTPPYLYSGYPENAEPGPFSRELAKRLWLRAADPGRVNAIRLERLRNSEVDALFPPPQARRKHDVKARLIDKRVKSAASYEPASARTVP